MHSRARHLASPRAHPRLRIVRVQSAQSQEVEFMAALVRLEHEREGRVLVDQYVLKRVHDKGELVRHVRLLAYELCLLSHSAAIARAAIAAVSLRSRFGPRPADTNPARVADSISTGSKSPSGPDAISNSDGRVLASTSPIGSAPPEHINASVPRGTSRSKALNGTASQPAAAARPGSVSMRRSPAGAIALSARPRAPCPQF